MEFNFKIKNAGENPGTLGYITKKLKSAKLVLKPNKSGNPAIFVQFAGEKSTQLICFFGPDWDEFGATQCEDNGTLGTGRIYSVYPTESNMYGHAGVFGYALTPAAKDKAEEFIDICVKKLREYLEYN